METKIIKVSLQEWRKLWDENFCNCSYSIDEKDPSWLFKMHDVVYKCGTRYLGVFKNQ